MFTKKKLRRARQRCLLIHDDTYYQVCLLVLRPRLQLNLIFNTFSSSQIISHTVIKTVQGLPVITLKESISIQIKKYVRAFVKTTYFIIRHNKKRAVNMFCTLYRFWISSQVTIS